ncbi:hypothetical protein FGO68_gene10303 [Halteria grandinella]|uniref:Uncharacterized protein n=1 Tax=Halteria grandinella TaxID=5974 RepID=A0A8J8T3X3_HALGN|nr:hypothetical protein FGO68_gene10303 [Halteria grandinella]
MESSFNQLLAQISGTAEVIFVQKRGDQLIRGRIDERSKQVSNASDFRLIQDYKRNHGLGKEWKGEVVPRDGEEAIPEEAREGQDREPNANQEEDELRFDR